MKAKLFIFDFDGTLADTKKLYFETIYEHTKKYGIKKEQIKKLLGIRLQELLKKLNLHDHVKKIVKKVNKDVIKEITTKAEKVRPCPKIKTVKKIKTKKILVSNSITKFLKKCLKYFSLKFDLVIGGEKFKKKEEVFKKIFRRLNIEAKDAIYIADKGFDVKIARNVGCKVAIISNRYSWSTKREIKKARPDFVLKNLGELQKFLK